MNDLEEKERLLLTYEVRTNKKCLEELLHPDFLEIGYSGKTWTYESTLENLSQERIDLKIHPQNYRFIDLSEDIIQVFYELGHLNGEGDLSRCSKRMSIWMKVGSDWKMRYHQATPVESLEKIPN